MGNSAAKGTPEICTAFIAWMGEKLNVAMFASLQTQLKVGIVFQDGFYSKIVLKNEIVDLTLSIPIWLRFKMFLNLYSKKPSVSLTILMILGMSLSYYKILTLSRSKARTAFF